MEAGHEQRRPADVVLVLELRVALDQGQDELVVPALRSHLRVLFLLVTRVATRPRSAGCSNSLKNPGKSMTKHHLSLHSFQKSMRSHEMTSIVSTFISKVNLQIYLYFFFNILYLPI